MAILIGSIITSVVKVGGRTINGIGAALTAIQVADWGLKKTYVYSWLFSRLSCSENKPRCGKRIPDGMVEKGLEQAESDDQPIFIKCPNCEHGGATITVKAWEQKKYWRKGDAQSRAVKYIKEKVKKDK